MISFEEFARRLSAAMRHAVFDLLSLRPKPNDFYMTIHGLSDMQVDESTIPELRQ